MKKLVYKAIKTCFLTSLFLSIPMGYAADMGPFEILTNTVEEARITVKSENENNSEGTIKVRLLECTNCKPKEYFFNNSTLLINPFGAEQPITALKSWSGSRALVRFQVSDKQAVLIKILP